MHSVGTEADGTARRKKRGVSDIGRCIMPEDARNIPIEEILAKPPIVGAVKWLAVAVALADVELHLASRQLGKRKDEIGAWLSYNRIFRRIGINPNHQHIIEEVDWAAKAKPIMELDPEFVVDDKLTVHQAVVKLCTERGRAVPRLYLFKPEDADRKEFLNDQPHGVTLVDSWVEIAKFEGWRKHWKRNRKAQETARRAKPK